MYSIRVDQRKVNWQKNDVQQVNYEKENKEL